MDYFKSLLVFAVLVQVGCASTLVQESASPQAMQHAVKQTKSKLWIHGKGSPFLISDFVVKGDSIFFRYGDKPESSSGESIYMVSHVEIHSKKAPGRGIGGSIAGLGLGFAVGTGIAYSKIAGVEDPSYGALVSIPLASLGGLFVGMVVGSSTTIKSFVLSKSDDGSWVFVEIDRD